MPYCSSDDLVQRLSASGIVYLADDDGDQSASPSEQSLAIDAAIASADAEIDAALAARVTTPAPANDWLRHRAIDLAAERLAERKGLSVPESLAAAARRSRAWLEEVRQGTRAIPGLAASNLDSVGPAPGAGQPRVLNPEVVDPPFGQPC